MKKILTAALFALFLIGCDTGNNPIDSSATGADVEFSETSMYKTTISTDNELSKMTTDSVAHDSLRHGRMLFGLLRFVGLTDTQAESVKVYGKTLFDALHEIRGQVKDSIITREEAKNLVQAARDQFVVSVKAILTAEQQTLFDKWILKFWNKHHRGGHGPGARGGHHGPGGRP